MIVFQDFRDRVGSLKGASNYLLNVAKIDIVLIEKIRVGYAEDSFDFRLHRRRYPTVQRYTIPFLML